MKPASFLPAAGALSLLATACIEDPDVGEAELPIAQELPNGVAEIVTRSRYAMLDDAMASYASPSFSAKGACSATMIAPNILMTAAHCGDGYGTAWFKLYRERDPQKPLIESFSCQSLVNTFSKSDLALWYCAPNGGENPGDRYGYLDLDPRPVAVNDLLTSFWHNPVGNLGLPWEQLHSTGWITGTNTVIWPPPADANDAGPINEPVGIAMNHWSMPGVSGSSAIDPWSRRVRVGPVSTAVSDGRGRWALSIDQLLRLAVTGRYVGYDNNLRFGVYPEFINPLGLFAPRYLGRVDKNDDKLFDIQADLDALRGETARDVYWLGFESARRNAGWRTDRTAIDANARIARVRVLTPDLIGTEVLRHPGLHLRAGTRYALRFRMNVHAADTGHALRVELQRGGVTEWSQQVPTWTGYRAVDLDLSTVSADATLVFHVSGTLSADLWDVALVRENTVLDFDSHDARMLFVNGPVGDSGSITPDGAGTPGRPNWAGVIQRSWTSAALPTWRIPTIAGAPYRICFDARRSRRQVGLATGFVAVGGSTNVTRTFRPLLHYRSVCTDGFVAQPDSGLKLGKPEGSPDYEIDNVRVIRTDRDAPADDLPRLPGAGYDIGRSATETWVIGTGATPGGYGIFRWTGDTWSQAPGAAVTIDVGPRGPWVINDDLNIFEWNGGGWIHRPGSAQDVGVGADGSVWVIGTNERAGGFGIFRWNGGGWDEMPGAAVAIDVGPDGRAWVVNDEGGIFRWTGAGWQQLPGLARDIAVSSDGEVWVIGFAPRALGDAVYRWNGSTFNEVATGGAARISAGPGGGVSLVTADGRIYHR